MAVRLPAPAPAPGPAPTLAAEPAPAAAAGPPGIPLPEPVACVFATERWRGAAPTADLRLRRDGPVFAKIGSPGARLHLPVGAAERGAVIEVKDAGLELRGHIEGSAIALRLAAPIVFGGFAVPTPSAALAWDEAAPDLVTVRFQPAIGVEVQAAPLRAQVRCGAVGLDGGRFDPSTAVSRAKRDRLALLRVGRAIPLALAPGGAPVAQLRARGGDDGEAEVLVDDAAGAHSRVIWYRDDALFFGWVPSADLRLVSRSPVLSGHGTGSGAGFGRSIHSLARLICPEDIPVIAEADGERATVGVVQARTLVHVMQRRGDHAAILVQTSNVQISTGVSLLAPEDRLAACEPAPK